MRNVTSILTSKLRKSAVALDLLVTIITKSYFFNSGGCALLILEVRLFSLNEKSEIYKVIKSKWSKMLQNART